MLPVGVCVVLSGGGGGLSLITLISDFENASVICPGPAACPGHCPDTDVNSESKAWEYHGSDNKLCFSLDIRFNNYLSAKVGSLHLYNCF